MSSLENSQPKSDNLMDYQQTLINRLNTIRINKQKILQNLEGIGTSEDTDEETKKMLMSQLVESYDHLSAQGDQYFVLLNKVVATRESAVEEYRKECVEDDGNKTEQTLSARSDDLNCTEVNQGESSNREEDESALLIRELNNLGRVASETDRAITINDKLNDRLDLMKDKMKTVKSIREKERSKLTGIAIQTTKEVNDIRDKLAIEAEEISRKQRLLERLRKESVRRGIVVEACTASESPASQVCDHAEPRYATAAKLRAKLEARKEKDKVANENVDQFVPADAISTEQADGHNNSLNDDISGEIAAANVDQMPPEIETKSIKSEQVTTTERKKRNHKVKEEDREQDELLNRSIRDKFASIGARKKRILELKSRVCAPIQQLNTMSEDVEPVSEVDEEIRRAKKNLGYLSSFREQLEEMQSKGGELTDETANLLEAHLLAHENSSEIAVDGFKKLSDASSERNDYTNEILYEVNKEFDDVMCSPKTMGMYMSTTNSSNQFTLDDSLRLKNIEQMLIAQRQLLLNTIENVNRTEDERGVDEGITWLRTCLLAAKPEFLQYLSKILLDLSSGVHVPNIDDAIRMFVRMDVYGDEAHVEANDRSQPSEKSDSHHVVHGHSNKACASPLSISENPPTGTIDDEEIKSKKIEYFTFWGSQALEDKRKKHLELLNDVVDLAQLDEYKSLTVVDKEVCRIMNMITLWLEKHMEEVLTEEHMKSLSTITMNWSPEISAMLTKIYVVEKGMEAMLTNVLSRYIDNKTEKNKIHIIDAVHKVLFDELSFLQWLMDRDAIRFSNLQMLSEVLHIE